MTSAESARQVLLGRTGECELLERLLAGVRQGQSAVLVVRGEAGIGKTALLRHAARLASGFRVERIGGVETEMELPLAGVHQLCAPMQSGIAALPEPQRDALSVALGLSSGGSPDRFLVGLAVAGLLSAAARERPLLCLVDDAQLLDDASQQVLGFVARRLPAESVAIVLAVREPSTGREFEGLPELRLHGLDEEDARALLARAIPGRLDEQVRDRIVAETRGNPLTLLELSRSTSAAELAGGFELPAAGDPPGRIDQHYLRRVRELPEATRRLLLLAAAEPVGNATLLWRAARRLEIEATALAPAVDADLLEIGTRVRFRHPRVRGAVYRGATQDDRRRIHEALAETSDPELDGDRRAWHRALAAAGPDEDVAAQLERSVACARERGGIAAEAAFLERAAALTVDPAHRSRRALAAAEARHEAGAPEAALALLANAEVGPLERIEHAEADLLRARIGFTSNRGGHDAALLLGAARRLEPLDPTLARDACLEALMAARLGGRLAGDAVREVADAVRAAPAPRSPRAPDLLLDGLALLATEGHAAAAPLLKRSLDAFRSDDPAANGGFRWLWLAEQAAIEVWDDDAWQELAGRAVQLARDAGALAALPLALSESILARTLAGEPAAAASLVDELAILTRATGSPLAPYGPVTIAAWRGRKAELAELIDANLGEAVRRGEGTAASCMQWASALLHNGLGQYECALASARQVTEAPGIPDTNVNRALPELVEAAARSGHAELARDALRELSERTRAAGTDWARGLEARCRALLSEHQAAEHLFRESIDRLGRTRVRGDHARAQLLYGEWLRREGRRKEARTQLRSAHRILTDVGTEAFAERAFRELQATGETVRARQAETRDHLTAQEQQIARLARDGLSNPEIGARLFLSPRTVEWHLRKVFTKLGIHSRRELASALPSSDSRLVPA